MFNVNLKALVERMNPTLKDALDSAAGLCLSKGHYNIEIEHWLQKILEKSDTDAEKVMSHFGVNVGKVLSELNSALNKLKSGNTRTPSLSQTLQDATKYAWMIASVDMSHNSISSGHLLAALLNDDALRRQLTESCPSLNQIPANDIRATVQSTFGTTTESRHESRSTTVEGDAAAPGAKGGSALSKFTINLTERAKNKEIDPVLGRDSEIRQCIDILTRRRQNNPIFTGEAGVGKTAVVEGLALRIANDDVPTPLKGVSILSLDLGLLQAGASVKGEFENRLKSVIEEVKASPAPIVMFIDEAHTLIGAGGKEGQGDAANLLKPALARGELRTIAATTWAEYKKYFERDPALTRRFQVVKVEEPSESVAIDMMRGISKSLQNHHKVRIADDAIVQAVKLSARYIPGRQLPDKSVSLLDTASARVALSLSATPSIIEDTKRRIQQLETNLSMLNQENASTGTCDEQIETAEAEKADALKELAIQEAQFEQEKNIIEQIRAIRDLIEADYFAGVSSVSNSTKSEESDTEDSPRLTEEELSQHQEKLKSLDQELADVQKDAPLMQPHVDGQAVADVVANWTGIPVGKMVGDEINSILQLKDQLEERVIGQSHALEAISQAIRTSRAGLTDPRKPIGVFMMVGSSGVGKTETALALADTLFGGEQNMTVINMSEFKEEHKISMLLGSPPGYVGFGEGGVLTEAARRKPYSVILLDEMEKAHPGVQDVFYNLFDKGTIKDGEGRDIDFKNTVIIMTSNAGEEAIRAICAQEEERPDPELLLESMRHELLKSFKPAFLGRANVITYYPLDDENLLKICKINMNRIAKRVQEHYNGEFSYHDDVLLHIVARSQEVDTGARNIETILNRTLLPELASECLSRMAEGDIISKIHVAVDDEAAFTYDIS